MTTWTEWHGRPPRDGEWRKVTLAYMRDTGQRLWLRCTPCSHERLVEPVEFATEVGLDMRVPLLTVSWALRCSRCGERKAHANPEPYGMSYWQGVAERRE